MKDFKLYLIFISERIALLEKMTCDGILEALEDETKHLAIERTLETVSDATKHIPENLKENYKHIEWHKIRGFRNRLAHDYLGIETPTLAEIIKEDIPELKTAVEDMLKNHG